MVGAGAEDHGKDLILGATRMNEARGWVGPQFKEHGLLEEIIFAVALARYHFPNTPA